MEIHAQQTQQRRSERDNKEQMGTPYKSARKYYRIHRYLRNNNMHFPHAY